MDKESFENIHMSAGSADKVLGFIRKNEPMEDQWENQILARAQLKQKIFLLSEMDAERVKAMGIEPILSIEDGLKKALELLGKDSSVALLTEGPVVYAK